jgi:hypothetical protein
MDDLEGGWVRFDRLKLNIKALESASLELGVRWPVTIDWMRPEDEHEMDAHYEGTVRGYRDASHDAAHRIKLRLGLSASESAGSIKHELAHCAQVERLLDKFDETYICDGGKALEKEACEMADDVTVCDAELVRPA